MKAFKENTNPGGRNHNEMSRHSLSSYIGVTPDRFQMRNRGTEGLRWPRSHSWEGAHPRAGNGRGACCLGGSLGPSEGMSQVPLRGPLRAHGYTSPHPQSSTSHMSGGWGGALWTGSRGEAPESVLSLLRACGVGVGRAAGPGLQGTLSWASFSLYLGLLLLETLDLVPGDSLPIPLCAHTASPRPHLLLCSPWLFQELPHV